jgi:hypothetical protein
MAPTAVESWSEDDIAAAAERTRGGGGLDLAAAAERLAAAAALIPSLKKRFRVLCVGEQPRTVSTLYRRDHTITIVYDTYTLHDR